ncbi:MAG TPA: NUDIX hydrolase [Acidimicrobiales bacterium]|nr:NUDIX hydrolase [Acidimicrobiales bacterium]
MRAAGGVLLRNAGRGHVELAVVHRPGRDDWSLPKGKLERGESFEDCALREVLEETGYRCVLDRFAGCTEYHDRRGRPKVVAYWFMDPASGVTFAERGRILTDEVDEVRWLELDVARRALTYQHDRELLDFVDSGALAGFG